MDDDPDLYFQFALAEKLGRTRAELLRTLSHQEYIYWQAYFWKANKEAQKQK